MPDLFIAKTPDSPSHSVTEEKPTPVTPGEVIVKKKEHHIFTSFHRFPEGITFENQEKDEKIYLFLRRHFITNIGWIFSALLLSLLPPVLFIAQLFLPLQIPEIPGNVLSIILLFYYLILFGFIYVSYVSWFYNAGIITNLRVVDIDINGLQSKDIAATALSDIVDVAYSQKGFLANIFDLGDVHMQTEGLKPNFEYLSVPHPSLVTDTISDLLAETRPRHG